MSESLMEIDAHLSASGSSDLSENHSAMNNQVKCLLRAMLKKLIPQMLSAGLFYRGQSQFYSDSFQNNVLAVERLIFANISGTSIADIVNEKFFRLWTKEALPKLLEATSTALLTGRTELSMSLSVQSSAEQLHEHFVLYVLVEANQWRNFDSLPLLAETESALFCSILREYPVPPYTELKLYRPHVIMSRLAPLPELEAVAAEPCFPFFFFLSTYFDQLITRTEELLRKEESQSYFALSERELLHRATCEIEKGVQHASNSFREVDSRSLVAKLALEAVAKSSGLMQKYLRQFVHWKHGYNPTDATMDWWFSRLGAFGGDGTLIAVHIISRLQRVGTRVSQFVVLSLLTCVCLLLSGATKVGAASEMMEDFSYFHVGMKHADSIETAVTAIEAGIDAVDIDDQKLERLWFNLLSKIESSAASSYDESVVRRLRVLGLSISQIISGLESCPLECEMSAEYRERIDGWESLRVASSSEAGGGTKFRLHALRLFLCPLWLSFTSKYRVDDFGVFVELVTDTDAVSASAATAILRSACAPLSGERSVCGFSAHMLQLIDENLSPDNHEDFTGDGKRSSLPHFIPEWLRSGSSSSEQVYAPIFPVYFSAYRHCFGQSQLADALFTVVVTELTTEAESLPSEQQYLNLMQGIDAEVSLCRDEFIRDRRLKSMDQAPRSDAPRGGTSITAIVISARVLLFLAKLSSEVACGLGCVLNGVHGRQASHFVESLMQSCTTTWQQFFVSRIVALRGEGTLASCLGENGVLVQFQWASAWSVGIPGAEPAALDRLNVAERERSETVADEERKAREFVLCPHCRQPFVVDQANCGQFVCGSDAHSLQGRPQLNGVVVNDVYGCGERFSLSNAVPYCIDREAIRLREERVAEEREALNICHSSQQLWRSATEYQIPFLPRFATNVVSSESILPTICLIDSGDHARHNTDMKLLKAYWKARDMAAKLEILPDLVEVRYNFSPPHSLTSFRDSCICGSTRHLGS